MRTKAILEIIAPFYLVFMYYLIVYITDIEEIKKFCSEFDMVLITITLAAIAIILYITLYFYASYREIPNELAAKLIFLGVAVASFVIVIVYLIFNHNYELLEKHCEPNIWINILYTIYIWSHSSFYGLGAIGALIIVEGLGSAESRSKLKEKENMAWLGLIIALIIYYVVMNLNIDINIVFFVFFSILIVISAILFNFYKKKAINSPILKEK